MAAHRALAAATSAYLFLAPFAGSAGLRGAMLLIAGAALAVIGPSAAWSALRAVPAAIRWTVLAWVALAVASLAWSVQPAHTLGELRAEVLYGIAGFLLFNVAMRDAARWRTWLVALLAGTAAVFAGELLQDALPFPISRHPVGGGPGPWSTHLVLVMPLLLLLAAPWPWGLRARGLAAVAAAVVTLVAAWQTENRMIWGAFAVELVVIAAWSARAALDGRGARRLRLAAIGLALAMVLAFGAAIAERSERLFSPKDSVTVSVERDMRPVIWRAALKEIAAAPWLGHGFGREVLASRFLPYTPTADHPPVRHGHNVFLDVAVQLGIVGLALFAAILGLLARTYVRYLGDASLAPLGVVGLAILAGFVAKNLTDDFMHRHNALVFWALQGMLLGCARVAREARSG